MDSTVFKKGHYSQSSGPVNSSHIRISIAARQLFVPIERISTVYPPLLTNRSRIPPHSVYYMPVSPSVKKVNVRAVTEVAGETLVAQKGPNLVIGTRTLAASAMHAL